VSTVGHEYPFSNKHMELHPSPLILFASSHVYPLTIFPSPQIGIQSCPGVGQLNPTSIVQVELQPSPVTLLKSSQN